MIPSNNKHEQYETINIDSSSILGIGITAEAFNRDYGFDYPTFPEGKDYPFISTVKPESDAYNKGLRVGYRIISLNGFSFYRKDITTILSDFEYEKRSCKVLKLVISR
jgi:C-terminal processing protease CtpA/Prc